MCNSGNFGGAKEMRNRLTNIRAEFDDLQTSGIKASQVDQNIFIEKAAKVLKQELDMKQKKDVSTLQTKHESIEKTERTLHEIQWDNLELEISRIHRPRMKYSKRAIELFKAESGLIRLKQYDDARKVRSMLDRLLPIEEQKFYKVFEEMIEAKRERLRRTQAVNLVRMDEKLKAVEWVDHRRRENEITVYVFYHIYTYQMLSFNLLYNLFYDLEHLSASRIIFTI